jgi:hypothetical protein
MTTMERKVISLHMNPGHGLRILMNSLVKLHSRRTNLNPTPEITGMALRALLWIHLDHLHLILLIG